MEYCSIPLCGEYRLWSTAPFHCVVSSSLTPAKSVARHLDADKRPCFSQGVVMIKPTKI